MPGFLSVRPQNWATATPVTPIGGLHAMTPSGIYASADGGATWATLLETTEPVAPASVSAFFRMSALEGVGSNHTLVALETHTGGAPVLSDVHVSHDGGATWTTTMDVFGQTGTLEENVPAGIAIIDTDQILIHNGLKYRLSTNGGVSWSNVTSAWNGDLAFYGSASATKIWGLYTPGSFTTIARWNHNGTSRETFANTGVAAWAVSDSIAICWDSDHAVADGKLTKVVTTTVTDITPAAATGTYGFTGAASPDGLLIVAHSIDGDTLGGKLWRSTNGGSSWTEVEADAALQQLSLTSTVWFLPSDPTKWAVIGYLKMFFSTDSGATWTSVVSPAPDANGYISEGYYVG